MFHHTVTYNTYLGYHGPRQDYFQRSNSYTLLVLHILTNQFYQGYTVLKILIKT